MALKMRHHALGLFGNLRCVLGAFDGEQGATQKVREEFWKLMLQRERVIGPFEVS